MAKGQAQAASNQLKLTNSVAGQQGQNASSLYSGLQPIYQAETQSQGYSPTQLSSVTNQGMGAVNSSFGNAQQNLRNTAARTRNQAGVTANADALARERGIAGGQEAGDIQIANANYANQQRQAGLAGLGSLFGESLGSMDTLYGMGAPTLNARAAGGSWMQNTLGPLLTGLGSLGGGVGAAAGGFA